MIVPSREMPPLNSGWGRLTLLVFMTMFGMLRAQVPVHEEPRHRPVFENEFMRILDVRIPPGDTTLYHIHQTPSFFITFTNTDTGSQLQGKEALAGRSSAGAILFEDLAPPRIRTHRVWNADTETFHVMDVELLAQNTQFVQGPLTLPGLELEIDTSGVRAYRLTLGRGKAFRGRNENHTHLLVSLDSSQAEIEQGGTRNTQSILPGSFFEIPRQKAFRVTNTGDSLMHFILLEIPVP